MHPLIICRLPLSRLTSANSSSARRNCLGMASAQYSSTVAHLPSSSASFSSNDAHSPSLWKPMCLYYTRGKCNKSGRQLHAHLIAAGLARLTHFATKLIEFYIECGKPYDARKVFDRIPVTNIRGWITLIGAYSRHGYYQDAVELFGEMQKKGLRANRFVIPSLLKACGHLSNYEIGKGIHCLVLKYSFEIDNFVVSSLIGMYSKCRRVDKAKIVFNGMVEKDLVSLNTLVSGCIQSGLEEEALSLVEEMQLSGLEPNIVTWNTLIAGFARKGDKMLVVRLFQSLYDNCIEPDVVSWTSVITGLVHNFQTYAAFGTFRSMLGHGLTPTRDTISILLSACASTTDLQHGKEIHGYAIPLGVEGDIYVKSALVDMYSKCGLIHEAKTLFSQMPKRNTVTWNSMIFGYANHGCCSQAIELFYRMEEEGERFDHLTFTAILTACCHARLIEQGKSLFTLMQEKYKIKPRLEHYACLVDLLGRAGRVTEAFDVIMAMPIEPDLFVWGALLGACRAHGNIDIAEIAMNHLNKLEPGCTGSNLLLTDLHASAGNWDNVARLKKIIKKRKSRFPGCSWVVHHEEEMT